MEDEPGLAPWMEMNSGLLYKRKVLRDRLHESDLTILKEKQSFYEALSTF